MELKENTEFENRETWTITCPDRFCRAESPFSAWIERGFFRCPKCGMLCYLSTQGKRGTLYSMGVYVKW